MSFEIDIWHFENFDWPYDSCSIHDNLCSFIQIIFLEGSGFTFYITAGLEEIYDKYGALLLRMQPTLGCFQLTASCARSLLSSCLLFETKHFFQEREKLKGT